MSVNPLNSAQRKFLLIQRLSLAWKAAAVVALLLVLKATGGL
ncbi:MAG TPA: hypothetical protein VGS18_00270 [Thermoplasmata archaeon]|nr:hypothetical protein [Thermoplasmata archaeon]